jgi:hypothetical protein
MKPETTAIACLILLAASSAIADDRFGDEPRDFSNRNLKGTWVVSGWSEATLLAPLLGELTHATPPSVIVSPGDKVTIKGTLVGLFEFDGRGAISEFRDLFKAGGLEPVSPPFPLPFLPSVPEAGHGAYAVAPDGTVHLSTIIVDPASGMTAGEAEYDCVLSLLPQQLDCMFSRFKTYVVDPGGYEAPIVGQLTMRPQRALRR